MSTVRSTPTWENSLGQILDQYGLVKNHAIIRKVLGLDMRQPLHMPVTRDLSASRRQLILDWMDAGMPRG